MVSVLEDELGCEETKSAEDEDDSVKPPTILEKALQDKSFIFGHGVSGQSVVVPLFGIQLFKASVKVVPMLIVSGFDVSYRTWPGN